jgi:cytochrome b involved in lipid metabolism
MSIKYMSLVTISALLLAGCTWPNAAQPIPSATPAVSLSPQPSANTQKISLTEIAKHNTAQDCWFAVENSVYDVTKYVAGGKHPGGEAILQGCGQDATQLFNARPGSGTPHSDKAKGYLETFKIGELAD